MRESERRMRAAGWSLESNRWRVSFALVAFGWLLGFIQMSSYAISYQWMDGAVPWPALAWNWLRYGLGALGLPWLVRRAWKRGFDRARWASQLGGHLGRVVALTLAVAATYFALRRVAGGFTGESYPLAQLVDNLLRGAFLADLYRYGAVSIGATAVRTALDLQSQAMEASRLNAELATTRLRLLKAQLDPHFLFNTLNAISASVRRDPDGAERMISRLSDLLRLLLESGGREEVTLAEELDHLDAYLEIQRTRFRDRLEWEVDVPPALLGLLVPNLALQPLVENAIRHGMRPRQPLRLRLAARLAGARLVLVLEDDGNGPTACAPKVAPGSGGVGLSNTRARLQALYGNDQSFDLTDRPAGGAIATITLPVRRGARSADPLTPSRTLENRDVDAFANDDRGRRAGRTRAPARSAGA